MAIPNRYGELPSITVILEVSGTEGNVSTTPLGHVTTTVPTAAEPIPKWSG
jgi:hypothetical protein